MQPDNARFRALLHASTTRAVNHTLGFGPSPGTKRLLRCLRLSLARGWHKHETLDNALRLVDHAWRSFPDDSHVLAPIYARLLSFDTAHALAALRLLQYADKERTDPDIAALMTCALLALHRIEEACTNLQAALIDYCVLPDGLLVHIAAADGQSQRAVLHSSEKMTADLTTSFRVDGRAQQCGQYIEGWARIGWLPSGRVRLKLDDEHGAHHLVRAARVSAANARWPFNIDLRMTPLRGVRITISAQLPDGRWQPLPDAPLILARGLRQPRYPALPRVWESSIVVQEQRTAARRRSVKPPVDVIIPVYRSREETLACITSVLATVSTRVQVLVIDDASDDAALVSALDDLAAAGRITLVRHACNQGFVNSVNDGLRINPTHDAVLLNSDTRVFDDWLTRLRNAAYSGPKVGTVTPFSNAATIASYPRDPNDGMTAQQAGELDALARIAHRNVTAEIPVGVGFCMYVRRDCWRTVGEFDAQVFGRGYGEEVDFCLRARARGWSHQLAANVFVHHAQGRSFGTARAALLDRAQRLIEHRHRGFAGLIGSFVAQDPLLHLRRRLDEQRLIALGKPCVLIVTLALSGGVDRFVADRCRALPAQGLLPLVLRPMLSAQSSATRAPKWERASHCSLWTDAIDTPNLVYDADAELTELRRLLGKLKFAAIEIQHFLHLDQRVIEMVRSLGQPYDVFVHDYAWICPRITLIDRCNRYCGEPELKSCERCARGKTPLGEDISVAALRARSSRWLSAARRVIAPSFDTAQRFQRYFPSLAIEVQSHTIMAVPRSQPVWRNKRRELCVALIGAIGNHKGYEVLHACARDARKRGLPLEFVVVGYTHDDTPLLRTGKVFVTGRYTEGEVLHLLRREQPDAVFLPSIWPETWCYALDYAFETGLQIFAFDVGAIAERLRAADTGVLLPLDTSASEINDWMLQAAHRAKFSHRQDKQATLEAER